MLRARSSRKRDDYGPLCRTDIFKLVSDAAIVYMKFKPTKYPFMFFVFFLFLSILVYSGILSGFDISSRAYIRHVIPEKTFTPLANFLDQSLKFRVVVPLFVSLLLIFAYNKKGLRIFYIFCLMFAIEVIAKLLIPQHTVSAPQIKNIASYFPFGDLFGDVEVTKFPYPSGHAARIVFFGFLIFGSLSSFSWFKKIPFLAYLILFLSISLVSLSRVYLFRHWTTDVIGGVFLGTSFGLLAARVAMKER